MFTLVTKSLSGYAGVKLCGNSGKFIGPLKTSIPGATCLPSRQKFEPHIVEHKIELVAKKQTNLCKVEAPMQRGKFVHVMLWR